MAVLNNKFPQTQSATAKVKPEETDEAKSTRAEKNKKVIRTEHGEKWLFTVL